MKFLLNMSQLLALPVLPHNALMRSYHSAPARWRRLITVAFTAVIAGCATPPHGPDAPVPPDISLRLGGLFTNGHHTYFVLDHGGELSFGGGGDALHRTAHPVRKRTEQEQEEIWQIILGHDLPQIAPPSAGTKGEEVKWDLYLMAGGYHRPPSARTTPLPALKYCMTSLFGI